MSNNWDFYLCRVNDKPASIFLDLGIAEAVPHSTFPYMAYISIRMKMPRDDGLSSQDEFDDLMTLEDYIKVELVANGEIEYVGRCTSDGRRDFIFYVASADLWQQNVANCLNAFPQYSFDADVREEPDWDTYKDFLYPSENDLQVIGNRRVCQSLEKQGDALTEPREIDHWAYFATANDRDEYAKGAKELGFMVQDTYGPDEDTDLFCTVVRRSDVPGYNLIDDITFPLYNLAKKHHGDYDGWETYAVT